MAEPTIDLLQQFESSRKEGNLFQGSRDYEAQGRWIKEQSEKLGAAIQLLVTTTKRQEGAQNEAPMSSGGVDPLYGDILDPEFFPYTPERNQNTYNFRCIVEHQPSRQSLKRYGIDEQREAIFHLPVNKLKEAGLFTVSRFRGVDIGDLILWDGTWYIVLSSHRSAYFGQTTGNYFTAATTQRYRLNSVPKEAVPDTCSEETA